MAARKLWTLPLNNKFGKQITFDAPSLAFSAALKGRFGGPAANAPDIGPDLTEFLSHPEVNDPASLFLTDGFSAVAAESGQNAVACIPDYLLVMVAFVVSQPRGTGPPGLTIANFIQVVQNAGEMNISRDGSWLMATPIKPYSTQAARLDRRALGTLARRIVQDGRVPLDAQAKFAFNTRRSPADILGMLYGMLLDREHTFNPDADRKFLQLFGSLSESDRRAIPTGLHKPFNLLTPEQKAIVESIVYSSNSISFSRALRDDEQVSRLGSLDMEPTEVLPNGLSPEGTLNVTVSSQQVVFASESHPTTSMNWSPILTPDTLAQSRFDAERPENQRPGIPAQPRWDTFRLGTQMRYSELIQVTPRASAGRDLQDTLLDRDAKPGPFSALPDFLRQKVDNMLALMRKQPRQTPAVTTPPPPKVR